MFNGNKLVVILPLILMVFLFAGGSFYINQAEVINNEELDEQINWETSLSSTGEASILEASWNWNVTPDDGMEGEDYIGVTFIDENGEMMPAEIIEEYELTLTLKDQEIEEDGITADNGIIFSFPNSIEENETLGDKGSLRVETSGEAVPVRAVISHLHTWEEHGGLQSNDARFFDRDFGGKKDNDESFFWVSERFVDLKNEKGSSNS
ncbi:hypothetical protein ACE1TI_13280 [Alteribacillus sp. JSM 102045]|uniref:hypothetical protein n=1 Tax=Alteribacillus sp. JSM 102045 TaxID=1562101 RepID=UPI0035BF70F6